MTTILAIGDPHFKADNTLQTSKMKEEVALIISKTPTIDAVVVLGDILHRHDKIDLHCLKRSIDFLRGIRTELDKLTSRDGHIRPLWIIIGNHDRPNNSTFLTDDHAFGALDEWNDTVVAHTVLVEEAGKKGDLFALVPYVAPGRFEEALGGPHWKTRITGGETLSGVFAHQEFKGVRTGMCTSSLGDIYPKDAPICISGHIHDEQWVGKNVHYPGTPYELGWWQPGTSCGNWGVTLYKFDGEGTLTEPFLRIPLLTVPKNLTLLFGSTTEFFKAATTSHSSNITKNILDHQFGSNKYTFPQGSRVRIRVTCRTPEEFKSILNTSLRTNLNEEGTFLAVEGGNSLQPPIPPSSKLLQAESFSQRLLALALKEPPEIKDFILSSFPFLVETLETVSSK
jgi:predicted phosphodiesterase